jgi:hypothetical protein
MLYLLAQSVANSIATVAIVVIPFALMGQWPPREMLIASSIGGAMSPFVWRLYRSIWGYPNVPSSMNDHDQPHASGTAIGERAEEQDIGEEPLEKSDWGRS